MKIVQKILSHGLLLAFVAAAFFAYTNRAEWFPQWFGKTGRFAQQVTSTPPDASASSSTDLEAPAVPVETPRGYGEESVVQPAPAAPAPAPAVPAEGVQEMAPRYRPEASGVVEQAVEPVPAEGVQEMAPRYRPEASGVVEQAVEPLPAEDPSEQVESPPPIEAVKPQSKAVDTEPDQSLPVVTVPDAAMRTQQAETTTPAPPAPERAEVVASEGADATAAQAADNTQVKESYSQAVSPADNQLEKQLEEARQKYWQRDLQGAATAYQALSEEHPENADVWGEVGNFYFSVRQRAPAAKAYVRCIELLVDQGDQARARQLLDILYKLDAPKARQLATQMRQTGG